MRTRFMSVTNGPICSTDETFGDATTSTSGWLLSTKGDTIRLCDDRTPSGPKATGYKGELCWDDTHIYVCVATNQWKRIAYDLLWI